VLIEVRVPKLAESVPDATLLAWQVQPGDAVKRGDNLIDLETDKVTLEVTAPDAGTIKELVQPEGATVTADQLLAILDTSAAVAAVSPPGSATEPPKSAERLSPAVRKLVAEQGLNPDQIPGSGKDGRITKADVLAYLAPPAQPASAIEAPAPSPAPVPAATTGQRAERRVAMSRLRKSAAARLLAAQRENAILTTFNEVNLQPVIELRQRYRQLFEDLHGIKLGFMPFFVKASVEALKRFPIVNAAVDGGDIVYHDFYDIGIAVGSERGLVVPILRDADQCAFADIERRIRDFGQRANDGKLSLDELTGGTFTITNGCIFGSLMSTPILNPPQSAILGMHKTQDRPVAEAGQIVIRPMMYVALSYDHRIIDGREAVQFLVTIKELIEDPARLLLQV
jgi:2-oxoglutarate dehydrogenase E2 component (dihydrolipoamide succinyltransferase)